MFKRSLFIVAACVAVFLSSCTTEEILGTDEFTEESVENFVVETRSGSAGCYEIVFPISIDFPDGTSVEIDSLQQGKELIRTWKEENPEAEEKPSLAFPIDLINEDGEIVTASTKQELRALVKECKMGNGSKGEKCFEITYPLTVGFPDGTEQEFETRAEIKAAIRAWKEANPDAEEKPSVVFPIEVTLTEDGSVVTVNSKEELKELKRACKE